MLLSDFPGGTVVKNPPANAGDTGSRPGQGRSHNRGATNPVHHNYWACALEPASHNYWAHVPQLLSPRATTTEARMLRACALQQREATAMRSPRTTTKSSPRSPQLEKAQAQQRRPNAAKNN